MNKGEGGGGGASLFHRREANIHFSMEAGGFCSILDEYLNWNDLA